MILYRKGTVSIADQYCLTTTIDNRWEVGECLSVSQCVPEFKFGFSSDHVHVFKFVAESPRCGPEVAMVSSEHIFKVLSDLSIVCRYLDSNDQISYCLCSVSLVR